MTVFKRICTLAGKKPGNATAPFAAALVVALLAGCSSGKSLSCFDYQARAAVSAGYVRHFASVLKNGNLEGVLWNVHTESVNASTGERTCSGQVIVYDKASRLVAFQGRADYVTHWDRRTGRFDVLPAGIAPEAAPSALPGGAK